ncbi:MAG: hypothetical protein ABI837_15805 [Acidobacteriota bacterium]
MRRTRPDLIVPIRDRRKSRRVITVRNLGIVTVVFILVFVGITIWSERGRHGSSDDYGRLFGTQVKATPPPAPRPQPIVREGQVSDVTAADPMLIVPAARAQIFGVGIQPPAPTATSASPYPSSASNSTTTTMTVTTSATLQEMRRPPKPGEHVAIVGGTEGVSVARTATDRPVLSGGIFKQPPQ